MKSLISDLMVGVTAHFKDKFGVLVEVQTPYSAEDLYVLWTSMKQGAKITIIVRSRNKRVMRFDLRTLDSEKTFSEIITCAFSNTSIPPAPALPREMDVYHIPPADSQDTEPPASDHP